MYRTPLTGETSPKTENLEAHVRLADRVLAYLRNIEGFKDPVDGIMPVPGFSKGVEREIGRYCMVVGVTPKEDKVVIHVGLTMSGKESETFTNVKFHPMSGGYLYTRNPLEVNIDDTMGMGMERILASLFPALDEGERMLKNPPPESIERSGDFPLVAAQAFKTRNKIMRVTGTMGQGALAITLLFAAAGVAIGPEHLNDILRQIPDKYLSDWLLAAKNGMFDFAEEAKNGGLDMILSRRYSGFVLALEGMKIGLIASAIGVAISEKLRRKPKYVDDL
ncbi:MAG: hypothetical protein NTX63_01485 [Candidatus Peregrinibacteria bacterium]|nr:hypothetical protein [Candidatus Peregrinibacteria bacterium]